MPIRFRCAYCNQLLGIARRKAGQVVRCPTCAGQVVVPQPEPGELSPEPPPPPPSPPSRRPAASADYPAPPVFERSDFDELFQEPVAEPEPSQPYQHQAAPAPVPQQVAAPPAASFDVERVPLPASPPAAGIVLSPAKATVLTVVVILGLALSFAGGWLVGRFF